MVTSPAARERSDRARVDEYIIGRELGRGSFAKVYLCQHEKTGAQRAIKKIDRSRLSTKLLQNLESEISILRDYQHTNIVKLDGIKKTRGHIFLVLEFCAGGDLHKFIKSRGKLSERVSKHFMRHLAAGLEFLWRRQLIHRDIKPQNLLLTASEETATLKIADFGFARHLAEESLADTLCGSPLYMAPEILSYQKYDAKADLWSAGTVLFEMLAGQPPYGGANQHELVENIRRKELRLPRGVNISASCVTLIQMLLQRKPGHRASFEKFLSADFLKPDPAAAASTTTTTPPASVAAATDPGAMTSPNKTTAAAAAATTTPQPLPSTSDGHGHGQPTTPTSPPSASPHNTDTPPRYPRSVSSSRSSTMTPALGAGGLIKAVSHSPPDTSSPMFWHSSRAPPAASPYGAAVVQQRQQQQHQQYQQHPHEDPMSTSPSSHTPAEGIGGMVAASSHHGGGGGGVAGGGGGGGAVGGGGGVGVGGGLSVQGRSGLGLSHSPFAGMSHSPPVGSVGMAMPGAGIGIPGHTASVPRAAVGMVMPGTGVLASSPPTSYGGVLASPPTSYAGQALPSPQVAMRQPATNPFKPLAASPPGASAFADYVVQVQQQQQQQQQQRQIALQQQKQQQHQHQHQHQHQRHPPRAFRPGPAHLHECSQSHHWDYWRSWG